MNGKLFWHFFCWAAIHCSSESLEVIQAGICSITRLQLNLDVLRWLCAWAGEDQRVTLDRLATMHLAIDERQRDADVLSGTIILRSVASVEKLNFLDDAGLLDLHDKPPTHRAGRTLDQCYA